MAEYYAQRASFPGTLLIAEASPIHPAAVAYAHTPGIWSDKHVQGWKDVVDAGTSSPSLRLPTSGLELTVLVWEQSMPRGARCFCSCGRRGGRPTRRS